MNLTTTPGALLEREAELQSIDDVVRSALRARGGLLVIEGKAGLGKSALAEVAAEEADDRGVYTLFARGHELEQDLRFGIAMQLFDRVLADAGPEGRKKLLSGAASLAAPIFDGEGLQEAGGGDLLPRIHGLQWLTSNLAGDSAVLLIIDDAQWADAMSMRFLLYLVQRLRELPVSVLVTLRPGDPETSRELTALRGHAVGEVRRLAPLSGGAVEVFVRESDGFRDADEAFCAECARITEGNPFLLNQLVVELREQGVEPTRAGSERIAGLAPSAVLRNVLARIARLPPGTGEVARALSVLEGGATVRRAASLAGVPAAQARASVDALFLAGIVDGGPSPVFAHGLIRSSIYCDIPAGRRAEMHLEAARSLFADGAEDLAAAQLLRAAPSEEPWVADCLIGRADRAMAEGTPELAATCLRRVLEEGWPNGVQESALRRLGEAKLAMGDLRGVKRLEQAAAIGGTETVSSATLLSLARALCLRGDPERAVETFDAALSGAGEDPGLRASLLAERFQAATLVPRLARQAFDELAKMHSDGSAPAASGERPLLAIASFAALAAADPRADVVALAERALGEGDLFGQEGPGSVALATAALVLTACDELDACDRILTAAVEEAGRRGNVMDYATASFFRQAPRLMSGRILEAIADAEAAVDARRYGWELFYPMAVGALAEGLIERRQLEAARKTVEELDPADWEGNNSWAIFLRARGRVAMASGDVDAALRDFLEWGRRWPVHNPAAQAHWRCHAALAHARLGQGAEAETLAAEELALASEFGAPRALGVAQHVAGLVEQEGSGIGWLREAVATLEGSQARLDHCRATVHLGAALRRTNELAEARALLREGLASAEEMGALALAHRAQEELKLAGGRPRRRELSGVDSLTPGELRVVELAAEGKTNREIAEALFVTVKAVEWHLRNAYPKLGVQGKKDLAAVLLAARS